MQSKVESTVFRSAQNEAIRKAIVTRGVQRSLANVIGLEAGREAVEKFEVVLREKKRKARKLAKRQRQRNRGVRC